LTYQQQIATGQKLVNLPKNMVSDAVFSLAVKREVGVDQDNLLHNFAVGTCGNI
jgi:hypothetical protein